MGSTFQSLCKWGAHPCPQALLPRLLVLILYFPNSSFGLLLKITLWSLILLLSSSIFVTNFGSCACYKFLFLTIILLLFFFKTKNNKAIYNIYVYMQNKRAHVVDQSFRATAILSELS